MIAASIAAFINTKTDFTVFGVALKAFAQTPDTVLSELPVPFCLVSNLHEPAQELWVVGDLQRKENPMFQVSFYAKTEWQMRYYEAAFRRLIESAKTDDGRPGIDYLIFGDFMRDSGDHQTYYSDQPNWFPSPAPAIYLNEDSNGEPTLVVDGSTYGAGGFGQTPWDGDVSINLDGGWIRFATARASTDIARASYKVGSVDFNIASVDTFRTSQETDVADIPQRFVVAFTLSSHYLIKTNANRYL